MAQEQQGEELKQAYYNKLEQMQQAAKIRQVTRQILSPAAYERLSNIASSNQKLYEQIVSTLLYYAQSGKIQKQLSEQEFISVVEKIVGSTRTDAKISVRRK
ncbi:hypothetical protein HY993_03930 [Candidatus Micrarchaeota archaeon]|nr:hypothetical protein [Candidatus Micrarchaeota archaeon]